MKSRYNILMLAAEHIEKTPTDWDFARIEIPKGKECGTPACAAGWIGYFGGAAPDGTVSDAVAVLGIKYNRSISESAYGVFSDMMTSINQNWSEGPIPAAQTMRILAETKFKPRRRKVVV